MPNPRSGETEQGYVSRFMASPEAQRDFPDETQRAAVAYSKFSERTNAHLFKCPKCGSADTQGGVNPDKAGELGCNKCGARFMDYEAKMNTASLCSSCGAERPLNNDAFISDCTYCGDRQLGRPTPPVEDLNNLCRSCHHPIAPEHDSFGCHIPGCGCAVTDIDAVAQIQAVLPNAADPHSMLVAEAKKLRAQGVSNMDAQEQLRTKFYGKATPGDVQVAVGEAYEGLSNAGYKMKALCPSCASKLKGSIASILPQKPGSGIERCDSCGAPKTDEHVMAMLDNENTNAKTYAPGTKGSTSGYRARVKEMYSEGMVTVRVPGGTTTIPVEDFIPGDAAYAAADAAGRSDFENAEDRKPWMDDVNIDWDGSAPEAREALLKKHSIAGAHDVMSAQKWVALPAYARKGLFEAGAVKENAIHNSYVSAPGAWASASPAERKALLVKGGLSEDADALVSRGWSELGAEACAAVMQALEKKNAVMRFKVGDKVMVRGKDGVRTVTQAELDEDGEPNYKFSGQDGWFPEAHLSPAERSNAALKTYCELCGHKQGLRVVNLKDKGEKTLCRDCAIGAKDSGAIAENANAYSAAQVRAEAKKLMAGSENIYSVGEPLRRMFPGITDPEVVTAIKGAYEDLGYGERRNSEETGKPSGFLCPKCGSEMEWGGKHNGKQTTWCKKCNQSYGVAQVENAGPGGFEYRTVDTRSVKGLEEAEKLKAEGWKIIQTGLDTIQFEREKRNAQPDATSAVAAFVEHQRACEQCMNAGDASALCAEGSQLLVMDLQNAGESCPKCGGPAKATAHSEEGKGRIYDCPKCAINFTVEKKNDGAAPAAGGAIAQTSLGHQQPTSSTAARPKPEDEAKNAESLVRKTYYFDSTVDTTGGDHLMQGQVEAFDEAEARKLVEQKVLASGAKGIKTLRLVRAHQNADGGVMKKTMSKAEFEARPHKLVSPEYAIDTETGDHYTYDKRFEHWALWKKGGLQNVDVEPQHLDKDAQDLSEIARHAEGIKHEVAEMQTEDEKVNSFNVHCTVCDELTPHDGGETKRKCTKCGTTFAFEGGSWVIAGERVNADAPDRDKCEWCGDPNAPKKKRADGSIVYQCGDCAQKIPLSNSVPDLSFDRAAVGASRYGSRE